MAKNFFEDIRPLTKKDSPIPTATQSVDSVGSTISQTRVQNTFEPYEKSFQKKSSKLLWILAVLCVGILFFSFSLLFSGAKVKITPKHDEVEVNDVFEARKSATGDTLPFEIMSVDGEVSKVIPSTGSTDSATKAKGTVVIYNSYSTASQKLIATTRIETSDGKIYRLDNAVTVPGMKTVNGKVTPGSVEANVTSDQPGDTYNIAESDFVVTGFKGTAKETKFAVRSKGPFTGGSTGKVYTISTDDGKKAYDELTGELKTKLLTDAQNQVPRGYHMFSGATIFDIDNNSQSFTSKTTDITLNASGTLSVFIVPEKSFTETLALKLINGFDPEVPVRIQNLNDMDVTIQNAESITPASTNTISLQVKGTPLFVWEVDTGAITKDLLGSSKKDFNTIIAKYPGVETAELLLKPFWITKIPRNESDIKITVETPVSQKVTVEDAPKAQ